MTTKVGLTRSVRKRTKYMPCAKSLSNLKPYKKGENGHQFGGYNLKERLKHQLYRESAVKAEELVKSTIEGAILREPTPFKEVWERVDGKVAEKHAIIGDILIEVVYVDRQKDTDYDESHHNEQ